MWGHEARFGTFSCNNESDCEHAIFIRPHQLKKAVTGNHNDNFGKVVSKLPR
jgi:hypothetical protein